MPLSDLIRHVHKELLQSQSKREHEGQQPLLELASVDLEINVVVREGDQIGGKAGFGIFAVTGRSDYSGEQVHKIKVSLRTAKDSHPLLGSLIPRGTYPRQFSDEIARAGENDE